MEIQSLARFQAYHYQQGSPVEMIVNVARSAMRKSLRGYGEPQEKHISIIMTC